MRRPDDTASTCGSSIVELTVAIAIVAVVILVMLQQISIGHRESGLARDQTFAWQKALGILAELQTAVERGSIRDAAELEAMADLAPTPVLTTLRPGGRELPPDHPTSGNLQRGGSWLWSRRIRVLPDPTGPRFRRIVVDVLRLPDGGGAPRLCASVPTKVQVPELASPSVQEHDVYVLALAAVPSTFLPVSGLRATFESALDGLRDPGLRFRVHWITELGYGRDPLYVPYVNTRDRAADTAPWAFWYPGRVDEVSPALYAAELFGGRVRTEDGIRNGYDAATNPWPFAIADRFNHALREPEARALFERRVAAGLADPEAPPLQLLLEDMHRDPARFRNAILIDLHGQVLPFPPLRNYSDAAEDPERLPGVRVVTHPGRLRPARDPDGDGDHGDSDDLELRVYAWRAEPSVGADVLTEPVTVRIYGVDLTANVNGADPSRPATLEVRRLIGGVGIDSGIAFGAGSVYRGFDDLGAVPPRYVDRTHAFEMTADVGYATSPAPHTWVRLRNTPLRAPLVGGRGLAASARLYGLDYVPSPVVRGAPGSDFPVDLATVGGGPKNTARWRIRVPRAVFAPGFPGGGLRDQDQRVTVETVLGDVPGAGTAWPVSIAPRARSVTWAWWARDPDAVPLTERYQVLGDPRHEPYADVVAGGATFPDGYNPYFDDLRDGTADATGQWPCLDRDRLKDGFGAGVPIDVPRAAQVWREALLASSAVFVAFGGPLAGSIALGGEVSVPALQGDLAPRPLLVDGAWFGQVDDVGVEMLEPDLGPVAAPGGGAGVSSRRGWTVVRRLGDSFWTRPWLGELVPDAAWSDYADAGNLRTGIGTGAFVHAGRADVAWPGLPAGTDFATPASGALADLGAATLLQSGPSIAAFRQWIGPGGQVVAPEESVRELFVAVGVGLPAEVPGRLSHGFLETLSAGLPQGAYPADFPPHYLQELERVALAPNHRSASSILRIMSPDSARRAFLAVLGDTPTTGPDQADLVRSAALLGVRALHVAGHPASGDDVEPVPRVLVTAPVDGMRITDPAALELRWRTTFVRFDGAPYTASYPASFQGEEREIAYRILVSADDGATWRDARSGERVDPGAAPDPSALVPDSGPGDESAVLALPVETFAAGQYRFRVVGVNSRRAPHRAWHEVRVEVARTTGGGGG